ncbi:MAG TPA: tail fiber domain-containing protein [Phycisphaerales bacterium]|nr:tail fiber domain-containing protein [Phycisphaerales bacterium]
MFHTFISRCFSTVLAIAATLTVLPAAAQAQPANETCATAIPLTVGTTTPFNSGTANDALPFTCTTGFRDVWFSFVAPVSASYVISSCDVAVSVYEGSCPTDDSTLVACGRASCDGTTKGIRFDGLAGLTYRIRVGATTSTATFASRRISVEFANPITYQGKLLENNSPYNGAIDVQFLRSAFADGSASNQVPGYTATNVAVLDGLFSTTFPASPDDAPDTTWYLGVRVRPAGTATFTQLLPRQRVTGVTRAIRANEADTVDWRSISGSPFTSAISSDNLTLSSSLGVGFGIGVATSPSAPLHVRAGTVAVTPSTSATAIFERAGTNYLQILSPDANEKGIAFGSPLSGFAGGIYYTNATGISLRTGTNDTHMTIDPAGLIGMGRTPTANKLEVNGNASKTTAGSWLANSDARIKQDIRPITSALDTLDRVQLVSFNYTPAYRDAHTGIDDRRYLNVIAQQFATVFPDWVQSSGEKLSDGSSILQVDTYPLTIYSAAAVQELHGKVKGLQGENAKLRERLADLDARLKLIEQARPPAK